MCSVFSRGRSRSHVQQQAGMEALSGTAWPPLLLLLPVPTSTATEETLAASSR